MKLSKLLEDIQSPRNTAEMLKQYPKLATSLVDGLKITNLQLINSINILPTTPSSFEIETANGNKFKMEYNKVDFTAIINGKRFYLAGDANEKQSAQQAFNKLATQGKLQSKSDQETEKAEEKPEDTVGDTNPPISSNPTEEPVEDTTKDDEALKEEREILQYRAGIKFKNK